MNPQTGLGASTPQNPPYDPWASFLVEASAGSGKTWQLSRRFLALVVAGADPSTILTVTFTKKAAAEMRERIVRDAVKLGNGSDEFASFVQDVAKWASSERLAFSKIRSAEEASRLILEKTQTLKITTIDALFMQWSQQFPLETAVSMETVTGLEPLQSPWDLLSNLGIQRLNNAAWQDVLSIAADHGENRDLMVSISENAPNGSIKSLSKVIDPLSNSGTFLWYVQMISGREPIRYFSAPEQIDRPEEFLDNHKDLIRGVLHLVSNKEKRAAALDCLAINDFHGLIQNKIIKSDRDGLNGNTFRTASKNAEPSFVELDSILGSWAADQKLVALNHTARLIWSLYNAREKAAHHRKVSDAKGTFSDAAKGVSIMACSEHTAGGRAMAWSNIRHLMLDEFQDTSRLQWMIFERLAIDLLSGQTFDAEAGPRPSVFIVGDKKQSIYRFREAAPEVMDMARDELSRHGLIPRNMSDSFRSSSIVLDLVNHVFEDGALIEDFPMHYPSKITAKADPLKSTYGTVTIFPTTQSGETNDGQAVSEIEAESKLVAAHIRHCVDGKRPMNVYDGKTKTWRLPRYSDFVVLYPKSTHSQVFEDEMRELGIPSRREERKGFFARPEIVDLNALVTWLSWPADTVSLCCILRSPICGMSDRDLQELLIGPPDGMLVRIKEIHPNVHAILDFLRNSHNKYDMSFLIGRLLTEHGLTQRYLHAFGQVEGPLAQANILKWFDLVRTSSADQALSAHTWSLALDEASEEDEVGNATLASNAVTLMTIHKSKGLEFPCVIVTGTAADWHKTESGWVKDSRPGMEGICYIGTKDSRPKQSDEINDLLRISEDDSRREKARILYVALTRASTHLVITGAQSKNGDQSFHDRITAAAARLSDVETAVETSIAETIQNPQSNLVYTVYTRGSIPQQLIATQANEPKPNVLSGSDQKTENKSAKPSGVHPLGRPSLKILTPSNRKKNQAESASEESDLSTWISEQRFTPDLGKAYGTVVHKLIENHLNKIEWSEQRLLRFLNTTCTSALTPSEASDLITMAKLDVVNLLESNIWKDLIHNAAHVHTEVPMASIDGQDLLSAKADLIIEYIDQSLAVIDFKTITLQPNLDDPEGLRTACSKLGYTDQVEDYCRLATAAFKRSKVRGVVLFTNPLRTVQVI